MHLADGPRCKRLGIDRLEHVFPGDAQLLLHHPYHLVLAHRRDAVLQLRELVDQLGREEVGASREHLPEFRKRRAELLERRAQPACAVGVCRRGAHVEPEARQHPSDLCRSAEQAPFDERLGRGRRHRPVRGVDDDDGAACVVRDAVRDVAEQELLPPAHACVADDEQVGRFVLGGAHDRPDNVRIDQEHSARPVERLCVGA